MERQSGRGERHGHHGLEVANERAHDEFRILKAELIRWKALDLTLIRWGRPDAALAHHEHLGATGRGEGAMGVIVRFGHLLAEGTEARDRLEDRLAALGRH